MVKKKMTKRTKMKKTSAKPRATRQGVLSLAEKVEKEFRQIPTKLAKLYHQEVMTLKQQDTKLKVELNKAEVTQKNAQKKQAELAASKMTATKKKQLTTLKKTLATTTKTIKTLARELEKNAKAGASLLAKHLKYTELNKELAKLEKQLLTKIKTHQPAKAQKKATKKIKNTKTEPTEVTNVTEEVMEETSFSFPTTETVEME